MSEKQFRDYFIRKLGGYSILKMAKFNESTNKYDSDSLCDYTLGFLDGSLVTFQEQQKRIEELETGSLLQSNHIAELTANLKQAVAELNSRETRINLLIQKWEKDAEYADQIASEDFVQNTLNDCIEELRQVIKGGDE
jgi:uncharacterized coiled-coil protein SlyX